MKKTMIAFLVCLTAAALLTAGCSLLPKPAPDTEKTPAGSETAAVTNRDVSPWIAPPQPIRFDSAQDAAAFLREPNLNDKNEEERLAYQKMADAFQKDGFLTIITHETAPYYDGSVTLYPEANYEDIGSHIFFQYDGELYQVIVYLMAPGISARETIEAYYEERMGNALSITATASVDHPTVRRVVFTELANPQKLCSAALLDENHYLVVRADQENATQQTMLSFIEGLRFDRLPIS